MDLKDIYKKFKELEDSGVNLDDAFGELSGNEPDTKPVYYWNNGKASDKYHDFADFFSRKFPNTKKCLIRQAAYCKDVDKYSGWVPLSNYEKVIESMASEVGLRSSSVKMHLSRWINEKKPEVILDPVKWDGKDHIKDALNRITLKDGKHEHFVELMKDWFSSSILRMNNSSHQNKFVIFRGAQGIGKDFSINSMLSGYKMYANEIDVKQSKTEVYRTIKNLVVAIIPEFDETNGSSISMLKSIVTAKSVEMRDLYKSESVSRQIRCSFISASNFNDILRDSSGNRRFVIIDIDKIEHTFEEVDGDQIFAQACELAKARYKPSKEALSWMSDLVARETPKSSEDLLIEEISEYMSQRYFDLNKTRMALYEGEIDGGYTHRIPERLRWHHISDDVTKMGRKYNFGGRKVQMILNRAGFSKFDSKSTYYEPIKSE